MPIVPYSLLNCVFYLYANKKDALTGSNTGGTGFFLAMPTDDGLGYQYGVTNWHVAVRDGFSCIRINTTDGPEVLEFGPEDWIFEPRKDDIAIIPLNIRGSGQIAMFIGTHLILQPNIAADHRIGPGDDVFMVGRFVDLDMRQTNVPSARFGNISTLPIPMKQATGYKAGLSYCLDMHSRTGYSGSPVFVYRTPGNTLEWAERGGPVELGGGMLLLLGIHWGQFREELPIKKERKQISSEARVSKKLYKEYVEGMSGMTCVLPGWNISQLLSCEELVEQRKNEDALKGRKAKVGS